MSQRRGQLERTHEKVSDNIAYWLNHPDLLSKDQAKLDRIAAHRARDEKTARRIVHELHFLQTTKNDILTRLRDLEAQIPIIDQELRDHEVIARGDQLALDSVALREESEAAIAADLATFFTSLGRIGQLIDQLRLMSSSTEEGLSTLGTTPSNCSFETTQRQLAAKHLSLPDPLAEEIDALDPSSNPA